MSNTAKSLTVLMGSVLNTFCALIQMVLELRALLSVSALWETDTK